MRLWIWLYVMLIWFSQHCSYESTSGNGTWDAHRASILQNYFFGDLKKRLSWITLSFVAEKTNIFSKLFRILHWITFILTIFQKKLAKKSYSTFDLRLSMTWAATAPIKTKYTVVVASSRRHGSRGQTSHENISQKVE